MTINKLVSNFYLENILNDVESHTDVFHLLGNSICPHTIGIVYLNEVHCPHFWGIQCKICV